MKVLIVHPHMDVFGGAETVITKLASFLLKKDVETSILTLSVNSKILEKYEKFHIITPNKKYSHNLRSTSIYNALGLINEINALRNHVNNNIDDYSLVNVHNFPATWSIFPNPKPVIWTANEPPDLWNNQNPSLLLKLLFSVGQTADKTIVNRSIKSICVADEFNANRIIARYNRYPRIIPYGIDYDFYSKGNERKAIEKFSLDNNYVLLQAGWITPQKNQFESIKTIFQLRVEIPEIKLILAGSDDTPYAYKMKKYVKDNDLENNVIFSGHINKELMKSLYHSCDVLLHPVRSQGGWLAPFEALCASKTVIVSPEMTASNIIRNNDFGKPSALPS